MCALLRRVERNGGAHPGECTPLHELASQASEADAEQDKRSHKQALDAALWVRLGAGPGRSLCAPPNARPHTT